MSKKTHHTDVLEKTNDNIMRALCVMRGAVCVYSEPELCV